MNPARARTPMAVLILAVVAACGAPTSRDSGSDRPISGRVDGKDGPEAGVWVIAETNDLRSGYTKIVVTDDRGQFTLPDLPEGGYRVWVRGYGLKDSDPVDARPGDDLALKAAYPSSDQDAGQVYPASYWYSLVEPPPAADFPGTGANGIAAGMTTQEAWIDAMK